MKALTLVSMEMTTSPWAGSIPAHTPVSTKTACEISFSTTASSPSNYVQNLMGTGYYGMLKVFLVSAQSSLKSL